MDTTTHLMLALRDTSISIEAERLGLDFLTAYRRDKARRAVANAMRRAPTVRAINFIK